jgi:hypothetical protein
MAYSDITLCFSLPVSAEIHILLLNPDGIEGLSVE